MMFVVGVGKLGSHEDALDRGGPVEKPFSDFAEFVGFVDAAVEDTFHLEAGHHDSVPGHEDDYVVAVKAGQLGGPQVVHVGVEDDGFIGAPWFEDDLVWAREAPRVDLGAITVADGLVRLGDGEVCGTSRQVLFVGGRGEAFRPGVGTPLYYATHFDQLGGSFDRDE